MGNLHKLRPRAKSPRPTGPKSSNYVLRLFTTGTTPRSTRAIQNLHDICEALLKGRYRLEVIDIYQEPGRASEADIIAAPTLIKDQPLPTRRMVGDLSDRDKVVSNLAIAAGSKS
jgi:circadian clock protein KaiB